MFRRGREREGCHGIGMAAASKEDQAWEKGEEQAFPRPEWR